MKIILKMAILFLIINAILKQSSPQNEIQEMWKEIVKYIEAKFGKIETLGLQGMSNDEITATFKYIQGDHSEEILQKIDEINTHYHLSL